MATAEAQKSRHVHGVRRDNRFRCLNPECFCEVKISREPFVGAPTTQNPRCCCGSAMPRVP